MAKTTKKAPAVKAVVKKKTLKKAAKVKSVAPARVKKPAKAATTTRNFLDPLVAQPAPSVTSDGRALPHTSLVSSDFSVQQNRVLLLATNTGSAGTVGLILEIDEGGRGVHAELLTIPTLALADADSGPSTSRAMKLSVSVVNCSNGYKRGGRVTYLNSSQRLPARLADADVMWNPVIDGIKSSPYRRRITGEDLVKPMQLIAHPVDEVNYSSFRPHRGTLTVAEFLAHVIGASHTLDHPQPRPMSIIAYVFEPVPDDRQEYSVTIRGSFYTRWPLTSVPGQSMRPMPTAAPAVINHVRNHAEETANDLAHVVEGGAAVALAPRVISALRGAVGNAAGAVARGAAAAEGAAVEAIGAPAVIALEEMAPLLL